MKTIKRTLAVLLTLLMLIGAVPVAFGIESGYCGGEGDGKNLTWSLSDAGILTIKGTGRMANYGSSYAPWHDGIKKIKALSIANGVTDIGDYAFADCSKLDTVSIPLSVTEIGWRSFQGCSNLKSMSISKNVAAIGSAAFNGCKIKAFSVDKNNPFFSTDRFGCLYDKKKTRLLSFPAGSEITSFQIPASVRAIDAGAFLQCENLIDVSIPNGTTCLNLGLFYKCSKLQKITIPKSVTKIQDNAFGRCSSLAYVLYKGTRAQWNRISVSIALDDNDGLLNAVVRCIDDNKNTMYMDNKEEVGIACGYYYSDSFFDASAFTYNHDLSLASCCLATAAMVGDNNTSYKAPKAATLMLTDIGFGDDIGETITFSDSYNYRPEQNSIAYVIASKNIPQSNTSIVAVSIRGGGYKSEWAGNFNVGKTGTDHNGFRIAANKVLNGLSDFLKSDSVNLCGNVKFWVTGYSRSAAVANLVAKSLNDSCSTMKIGADQNHTVSTAGMNYQTNDIFSYCFETPKNTTDKNSRNQKYGHIFNIVNRIDPVPRVAPLQWGFTRYGIDCYLPSMETTGKETYTNLLTSLKENYREIDKHSSNNEYKENFKWYKLGFHLEGLAGLGFWNAKQTYKSVEIEVDNANKTSQGVFLDNLIQLIAKKVVKSRTVFANEFQSTLMSVLAKSYTTGLNFPEDSLVSSFVVFMAEYLLEHLNWGEVILNLGFKPILKKGVDKFCQEYHINLSEKEVSDAVDLLFKALVPVVSNYNTLLTLIKNGEDLIIPHKTETTLAWLVTLRGEYAFADSDLVKLLTKGEKSYRIATINCPVDVRVYDADNDLRGEIIKDDVQDVGDFGLSVYINDDGEKCFILPNCEEFRFEIEAYDDGDMSLSFADFDFTIEEKTEGENYYDIPIQNGTEIVATVSEKSEDGITSDVVVTDADNKVIEASETIEYNTEDTYTVSVLTEEDTGSVLGGGEYFKGEFSQVTALNKEGYEFTGWYEGDQLVSLMLQYRFRVDRDVTLTAKFKPHTHDYTSKVTTEPTCQTSGVRTFTCACEDSYTEDIPIDANAHDALNENGDCPRCGKHVKDVEKPTDPTPPSPQPQNVCKWCGKTHEGFIQKIIGFFHNILAAIFGAKY